MISNVEAEELKIVNDDSAKRKNLFHVCETLNTCKSEIYDFKKKIRCIRWKSH